MGLNFDILFLSHFSSDQENFSLLTSHWLFIISIRNFSDNFLSPKLMTGQPKHNLIYKVLVYIQ